MTAPPRSTAPITADALRHLALEAGAHDVGFVEIEREAIQEQRRDIEWVLPGTRTLLAFVVRMNRENIRTPARAVANLEFHHAGDETNEIARRIVAALEAKGIRAANGASMGFPMEMDRWPERMWTLSHKPVAVEAGLGRIGIHRNVIHPRFGSFVLLGTVLTEAGLDRYHHPLTVNPCLECKLCVAACPTGAIKPDGAFDFAACYTHNYREFMGGFGDWIESVVESRSAPGYRQRVSDSETVSMWQSLAFGPNYNAAYCLSVCPAGEDVIGPFTVDRGAFLDRVVRPLQAKRETVFVVGGSDAEAHVRKRFPHKQIKKVGNGLRPRSVEGFLDGLPLLFQRGAAKGMEVTYHFSFRGRDPGEASVDIRQGTLMVRRGLVGRAGLRIRTDSTWWLRFVAGERSLLWGLLRGKIRLRGNPRHLVAFGRCFPS